MDIVGIDAAVAQRRAPDKVTFDAALAVGRRVGHATFPDAGEAVFHPTKPGSGSSWPGWSATAPTRPRPCRPAWSSTAAWAAEP